jgi:hypothetical protein
MLSWMITQNSTSPLSSGLSEGGAYPNDGMRLISVPVSGISVKVHAKLTPLGGECALKIDPLKFGRVLTFDEGGRQQ